MKKFAIMITSVLATLTVSAQETYENARLMETDLNGTARYVAMGGAMDALGADISTISTNPAGIGLFRHSMVSTSFGIVSQEGAKNFRSGDKTNASFDQIGFVWSNRTNKTSFFNFAFNFHKSQNFDYILSAAGQLDGNSSQNGLSHVKAIGENDPKTGTSTYLYDKKDAMGTAWWTNQLDNLYYNTFILDGNSENPCWNAASDFLMNRANTGYIGEYDINLSGNINNRVYLGFTVGIHDVHYKGLSEYTENLLKMGNVPAGQVTVNDERTITGTGVDMKAGIIFRPIESSPFRIGLSVATPTFYKLKSQSSTRLINNTEYRGPNPNYVARSSYEFKLYTPWKFGLSLGHTIDQFIALGAGLEYADYSSMDTREITDEYYDYYYDTTTTNSESDVEMNRHTSETLKGVLQLKLGAEVKIDKNFAVRFGYNYASPMYKENGSKDFDIDSYGTNCASATDFTNWKATNRLTCGFGYRYNNFSVDLAYQYSVRKGNFYPFQSAWGDYYYDEDGKGSIAVEQIDITPTSVSVENKRHQVLLTLGYTF
jgi:hypothetical protein